MGNDTHLTLYIKGILTFNIRRNWNLLDYIFYLRVITMFTCSGNHGNLQNIIGLVEL